MAHDMIRAQLGVECDDRRANVTSGFNDDPVNVRGNDRELFSVKRRLGKRTNLVLAAYRRIERGNIRLVPRFHS